jgi:hypothetical protein
LQDRIGDNHKVSISKGGISLQSFSEQLTAARKALMIALLILLHMFPQGKVNMGEALASGQGEPIRERYTVDADLLEWYKQPNEPVEGQAYVTISTDENPLKAIRTNRFASGVGWRYTFCLREENGVNFTVEECSVSLFFTELVAEITKYGAEEVTSWWDSNVIPKWGQRFVSGGFPRQELLGVGVLITGVDANGNQLEFRYFLELSQEIAEDATEESTPEQFMDDPYAVDASLLAWYKQPNEPVEGQAYVTISAGENPLKAVRADHFSIGVGWYYTIFLTEENGIDFTVDEYSVAMFYTDTRALIQKFDAQQIKSWWGDNVILGWGRQHSSGGFPRQEMLGIGVLITGVDANGNQLEFHYFIEMSQEIAE